MSDKRRKHLSDLIEQAFQDVSLSPDDHLLDPRCIDDNDVRDFVGLKDWRDVPASVIESNSASLCFFSPMAMRAFVASYLIWVVLNFDTSSSFTVDATIYSLDLSGGNGYLISRYSQLSHQQRRVVKLFLLFLKDMGGDNVDQCALARALATPFWDV